MNELTDNLRLGLRTSNQTKHGSYMHAGCLTKNASFTEIGQILATTTMSNLSTQSEITDCSPLSVYRNS